jgi:hypothetical protein
MEYDDLHVFPDDHPPTPYGKPAHIIKIGDGFLPKGLRLCAVGWIEKPGFSTGAVPDDCIEALVVAHAKAIVRDGTRGIHSCAICSRTRPRIRWRDQTVHLLGYGHYLVQLGEMVYMAPELLLHYIRGHRYRPPDEFVEATIRGRFLTEDDLDIQWKTWER